MRGQELRVERVEVLLKSLIVGHASIDGATDRFCRFRASLDFPVDNPGKFTVLPREVIGRGAAFPLCT